LAEADRSATISPRDKPHLALSTNGSVPRSRIRRRKGVITRADRARSTQQWPLAARLYRKALNRNPRNPPIWVQYGHALKEAGDLAAAETAYRTAIDYDPDAADSYLHLGHLLKLRGAKSDAAGAFFRTAALSPAFAEPRLALS